MLKELKDNLKTIREQRKLTKKEVATGAGISERAYIAYEYGERDVSTDTLCKLADFYDVSADVLLGRDKSPASSETALDKLAKEYNMTSLERNIVDKYISLPDNARNEVMQFLRNAVKENKD